MASFSVPLLRNFYNGEVAPNSLVWVYESGTTTLVTLYADGNLTSPTVNPYPADSNGEVLFYVDSATNLRFDIKTSGGTLIRSIDPVYPVTEASSTYAPINNPTFTGDPKVPTPPIGDNSTSIASTASVLNAIPPSYRNALANTDMLIAQRGSSFTSINGFATPVYTLDRWFAWTGGSASMSVSQAAGANEFAKVLRVQRPNGNTSTTGHFVGQILESVNCTKYKGKKCYLSFYARSGADFSAAGGQIKARVQQGTGTDQGSSSYTNGLWTSASLALDQLQDINSTLTRYSLSLTISASATEIAVDFSFTPVGTAGTNDYFEITGVQLEANEQTPYEFLPYSVSMLRCLRYYTALTNIVAYGWASGSGQAIATQVMWPVPMRSTPTTSLSGTSYSNAGSGSVQNVTAYGGQWNITSTGAANTVYGLTTIKADAEL